MAMALIYLLLVVNFQSWLDPFIIITALTGALAGVIWGLSRYWHNLERPSDDGRDHVPRRGYGQFGSGRHVCTRQPSAKGWNRFEPPGKPAPGVCDLS